MRYEDDDTRKTVNAQYAGVSVGTRLADGADPDNDGLDHLRATEHVGTVLQDGAEPGIPVPIDEEEE
ncbi:hypothetical protein [Cohnella sp. GbtcB17]|uniref:hypothetical protein n=1 Tax=Cohnella sp. GbtcB17 TaxID=2824762 RepID=UPI001C30E107|nr:hypothetical protein [Cohnella sp. GbtcB17]